MILEAGGLDSIVELLKRETDNKSITKSGISALSSLCSTPLPQFDAVKNAIAPFAQVLKELDDPDVLTVAAWAIAGFSGTN
mgnify:FL=1